jgi:hypothetical protein
VQRLLSLVQAQQSVGLRGQVDPGRGEVRIYFQCLAILLEGLQLAILAFK